MNPVRKIIGLLVIILFGLPLLFGVIWTVGLTKAAISPEFVSEVPQEIIAAVPDLVDEIVEEAQRKDVIADENTRAWFQAIAQVELSPKDLLTKIGILDWLEQEMSESLGEIGDILRGERRPRTVVLDFIPLKEALLREDIDLYILEILKNFPPCDDDGVDVWKMANRGDFRWHKLPTCQPDLEIAKEVLRSERIQAISEIPDAVEVFEDVHSIPYGFSRTVTFLSYLLFFIPAFFLCIGALIAATSPSSFLKWLGISSFIGGLFPLGLAFFARQLVPWVSDWVPYSYSETWPLELQSLIFEKTRWIQFMIMDHLFSPVIAVAGIVCIVGIVFFALSFVVRGSHQRKEERVVRHSGQKVQSNKETEKHEPESTDFEKKESEEIKK
jgi:hypothetical protein